MDWMTVPIIWRALLVATIGDLFVPFALKIGWPEYSLRRQAGSDLGAERAPTGVWYRRWLLLAGLLFLLGAMGVFALYAGQAMGLRITLAALVAVFALGVCVLGGLYPTGEKPIQRAGTIAGFAAMVFVPLVLSRLAAGDGDSVTDWLGRVSFVGAAVCCLLYVLSDRDGAAPWLGENTGIWQRLALLFMYLPLIWIGAMQLI